MPFYDSEPIIADAAIVSDRELVERVLAGERDAYALLVDRHAPMIHRFLAGRGMRGADLDDAAQDVFVRVYQKLGDLREPEKFGGYLMTAAARRLADMHRRRRTVNSAQLDDIVAEEQANGAVSLNGKALQQAVSQLPRTMQVVLGLKYGDGKTAAEIGEILGQSVNSVTKTLSRAYERLRSDKQLQQAWWDGESS